MSDGRLHRAQGLLVVLTIVFVGVACHLATLPLPPRRFEPVAVMPARLGNDVAAAVMAPPMDRAAVHRLLAEHATLDDSAVPSLERTLAEATDPLVVAQAIATLSRWRRFGDQAAHIRLLEDGRLRVRQEAVRALGSTCDPRHADTLVAALARRPELEHLIVQALGHVGGDVARHALKTRLQKTADVVSAAFLREALRACDARGGERVAGSATPLHSPAR